MYVTLQSFSGPSIDTILFYVASLQAMDAVGVRDFGKCFYVDDSLVNVQAAKELGWQSCIHFDEPIEHVNQDAGPHNFDLNILNAALDTGQRHGAATGSISTTLATRSLNEVAIQNEFAKMSHPVRIRLVNILFSVCSQAELIVLSRSLEARMRLARDSISTLPDPMHLRILGYLDVPDLLRCRQVCTKWDRLSRSPPLWRRQALRLTWGDPIPLSPPAHEDEWESIVKGLYWRERNWAQGLAQSIKFFHGHTGYVTSIKIKGRTTLVTGSYDETVRVWDLRTGKCNKVLQAKAISCLDFLPDENILCAGLYDTGRVLVWDMKTWELLQTLSGHNKGIRHVALSRDYLISCGQDKAIVVWDWKSGNKIVRLGQQSNVSLGVSIVDENKIVAVTVDGIIRTFSIPQACMIQQFDLHKLGGPTTLRGDKSMLQWFQASAKTITVASKQTVVHLQWQEHFAPVEEYIPPSEIRKIVSARSASAAAGSVRARRSSSRAISRASSSMSITSSRPPSSISTQRPTAPSRPSTPGQGSFQKHANSISSPTSSVRSASTLNTSNSLVGGTPSRQGLHSTPPASRPSRQMPRHSAGAALSHGTPPGPRGQTPSKRSVSATAFSSKPSANHQQPANMHTTRVSGRRISEGLRRPSTQILAAPHEEDETMDEISLSRDSEPNTSMISAPLNTKSIFQDASDLSMNGSREAQVFTGPMRYQPNLAAPPKVVEVLHSPDMATGAVDAAKQRIVCSTFSSRAGSDRHLYVSTYRTRDPALLGENSAADGLSPTQENPRQQRDPVGSDSHDTSLSPPADWCTGSFVRIGGAWTDLEPELQARSTRPLAMVVDHESIVVGCHDGTLYRIGFIGDSHRPSPSTEEVSPPKDGDVPGQPRCKDGIDLSIDDITLLRETWRGIMLPPNAPPNHLGRQGVVAQDHWAQLGLK